MSADPGFSAENAVPGGIPDGAGAGSHPAGTAAPWPAGRGKELTGFTGDLGT
jgi:hypothetical protein